MILAADASCVRSIMTLKTDYDKIKVLDDHKIMATVRACVRACVRAFVCGLNWNQKSDNIFFFFFFFFLLVGPLHGPLSHLLISFTPSCCDIRCFRLGVCRTDPRSPSTSRRT